MRCLWMPVTVLGLFATTVSTGAAQTAPAVTLSALLEASRHHHPTLAERGLLKQSLAAEKSQLDAAYYPQLAVGGSATWQSDVTQLDLPVPGVEIEPLPKDQYKLTLDLQQTLWDFGGTADRKRVAETRARLRQRQVDVEWHQIRNRIVQLYFTGVVQQQLRAQAHTLDGYLATTVEKAQVALAQGVVTERDVLLARARKLQARHALVNAEARLQGVRRSLAELTGQALGPDAVLAAPEVHCEQRDDQRVFAQTLKRPELEVLSAQREILDAVQEAEEAADRPRISAFATTGYGRPGLNMLSRDFDFFFMGGLRIAIPLTYLYSGTHRQARAQLAKDRAVVDKQQEALLIQVNTELSQQQAEVQRLDATLALDAELVALREGARKQVEVQLELGTATMTDLLNDLSQEDQARSQLAIHRYQRSLACHEIALTLGEL